jgi:WD40 repeat protein
MSSTADPPQPGVVASSLEYDLFVVHSAADRAWVDGYLKHAVGLDPSRIFTRRDFRLGENVAAEFERGVTTSRFTLLVLSPSFLADRWSEFGEGLVSFSSVDEGRNRLLALMLHACQAPLRLRFKESLDCTDWSRWDEEAARLRRHLDAPEPVPGEIVCPYPGMVPFREQDARFFHGRDDETQSLIAVVRHHHFLVVIGSSGSGKSSLVKAGLLPNLQEPKHFPRGTWRVLTMRPGATPIDELSRTLAGVLDDPAASITAALVVDPPSQRLLLFVDQFEELFSQVKEAATRDAFLDRLKSLRADPRCTVILTMRADFYGDLMNSSLWPVDRSQIMEIVPLRGVALGQAIVKPAEAAGVYLDEGLVERLISDAANEPGSLPMLQEALVMLWGKMSGRLLTRASYDTLGRDGRSGLAVAMAMKADATLADLPADQQRIARRIFLRLVQFGEGRPDTRRQLAVDELRAADDNFSVFDEVLKRLVDNRLLSPSIDEARGLRLDIAHEMLIVGWPASREWVEVRRNAEKTRRRLAVKAEEWVRLGRGDAGLLDVAELAEAEHWLATPDASDLGIDADVRDLAIASHDAIESRKRRRRMWTRVATGGLTTALVVISAFAVWGELEREDAVRERLAAEKSDGEAKAKAAEAVLAMKQAEKNADEAKARAAEVLLDAGSSAVANGQIVAAMHRFAGAINTLPEPSALGKSLRKNLGLLAREMPRLESILVHPKAVDSAAFSPDGARVVTASHDNTARVWHADTGAVLAELKGHAAPVASAAFSPDGARVVTASHDNTARVWRADTGALLAELKGHADSIFRAKFSPDGARVVTASLDKTARVWHADTGALLAELKGHARGIASAAFSPDGKRIVTASHDGTARVVQADTGALLAELKGHAGPVASAAFSPDGTRIVTASSDQTARVWRSDTGAQLGQLIRHTNSVVSASFSPDGTRIVTASHDGTARVVQADTGALLAEIRGHSISVNTAAFSHDGARVVTASNDHTARLWRLDLCTVGAELKGHEDLVRSGAFSPDGTRVVTASFDNTARVWRADTGSLVAELKGHAGQVGAAVFSPDGSRVATSSADGTARVWRVDPRNLVSELKGHAGPVEAVAFSPDGSLVVTASDDNTARVWRADTGAQVAELRGHLGHVFSTAFSPDGSRVVTASFDGTARVWRADTGSLLAELKGHLLSVMTAAFSPDGSLVVTASADNTGRVWRTDTGSLVAELKGHTLNLMSAAFSPDGSRVVTVSLDGTARVWRADTGSLVSVIAGPARMLQWAAFSPDGSLVVTASADNTARIWRADSGILVAVLMGHTGPVVFASFCPKGDRIITASADKTARIWRYEILSGNPSSLPLWVEVITGTELRGGVVQGLPSDEWNRRKAELLAKRDQAPSEEWFEKTTPKDSTIPAPAR